MATNLNLKLIFNPFETVLYSKDKDGEDVTPHSRSLHTSLWEKIQDTFQVFDGKTSIFGPKNKENNNPPHTLLDSIKYVFDLANYDEFIRPKLETRPGIFDYVTLGLFRIAPLLMQKLYAFTHPENENLSIFQRAMIGVAWLPLNIAFFTHMIGNGILRHLVSATITFAMLPVIALSHAITNVISYFKRKKALEGEVKTISQDVNMPDTTSHVIIKKLKEAIGGLSLEHITAVTKAVTKKDEHIIILSYKDKKNNLSTVTIENVSPQTMTLWCTASEKIRKSMLGDEACKPRYR